MEIGACVVVSLGLPRFWTSRGIMVLLDTSSDLSGLPKSTFQDPWPANLTCTYVCEQWPGQTQTLWPFADLSGVLAQNLSRTCIWEKA